MTTPASIVIEFGTGVGSGALALAELDEVRNVDAAGNVLTQFAPGVACWFLVHHDTTMRIGSVRCTCGQVADQGNVTRTRAAEAVLFSAGTLTSELAYIVTGNVAARWYDDAAAVAGVPRTRPAGAGTLPTLTRAGRVMTAVGGVLPALADLSMQVVFRSFKFTPPVLTALAAGASWPVRIVVRMEAVEPT